MIEVEAEGEYLRIFNLEDLKAYGTDEHILTIHHNEVQQLIEELQTWQHQHTQ